MPLSLQNKVATVFGGTGFIGRYIVAQLAREGATIKVMTRHPQSAYFLRQFGVVGQIVPILCNYSADEINRAVAGSDVVVNCLGVLFEKRKAKFKTIHADIATEIASACARSGVKRFVHISALGIEQSKSKYAMTKRDGETAIRAAYAAPTILRPSVVFGAEDNFFNKFAKLAMLLPGLPLIAGGHSKFQPVYAGDVADAAVTAITLPDTGTSSAIGKTYELGGPEILTMKEIYERVFTQIGRKRFTFNLPEGLARIQAAFFSILPTPPLTNDQITSLKSDNIVSGQAFKFSDLGITPKALDTVLPSYMDHYRPGGRFADVKVKRV